VTHSHAIGHCVPARPATTATPTTAMTISRWDRSDHRADRTSRPPSSPPRTFAVGVRDGQPDPECPYMSANFTRSAG
jgi:hypothetical protein